MTKIRTPSKKASILTVAGVVALVGFVFMVEDRYIPSAFAGEIEETLKQIRGEIADVRKMQARSELQNELDRWSGRVFDLEAQYGVECEECPAGSAMLKAYLASTQQVQRLQSRIDASGGRP